MLKNYKAGIDYQHSKQSTQEQFPKQSLTVFIRLVTPSLLFY